MGSLISLFWTSSDVSSGFQNQSGHPKDVFTLDVCVCINVTVKLKHCVNVKCQEWVQIHSVCFCLGFHLCNVRLDGDVDADANANVKCEHSFICAWQRHMCYIFPEI